MDGLRVHLHNAVMTQTVHRNASFNRVLVGSLAVGCGVAGVAMCIVRGLDDPLAAGFIRVGVALGALWCALPTRTRAAAWARVSPVVVIAGVLAAVVFVRHLRVLLPIAVVLASVGYVLRPRKGRAPR